MLPVNAVQRKNYDLKGVISRLNKIRHPGRYYPFAQEYRILVHSSGRMSGEFGYSDVPMTHPFTANLHGYFS